MAQLPEFRNYTPPCYFVMSQACPGNCALRLLALDAMEKTYINQRRGNPRLPPPSDEQLGRLSHALMIQQAARSVADHIEEARDEIETFCREFDPPTPPCDFLMKSGLVFGGK